MLAKTIPQLITDLADVHADYNLDLPVGGGLCYECDGVPGDCGFCFDHCLCSDLDDGGY